MQVTTDPSLYAGNQQGVFIRKHQNTLLQKSTDVELFEPAAVVG